MARKSRKHPNMNPVMQPSRDTVGYIRISVRDQDRSRSIQNQKHIIEDWGHKHQIPISHYYIDNGFSGTRFDRPAFQEMIQDILSNKIECIIIKDLSRLGRNHIAVGYYLEIFFPQNRIRFVSVNEQFETIDGMTNQIKDATYRSGSNIPLINLLNEQVSIETKVKVKEMLFMKAKRGEFIGPRAPFGYQKSSTKPEQLIPDPVSSIVVRQIFAMAAAGTGVTAIVRHLNERGILTPIQYARSNGLSGNYNDGNGSWNSRSVKYILTNRTYTGMLVQGKEKQAVDATHEPLVDAKTFDTIQRAFQAKSYNIVEKGQTSENILKGKVICGCCGGRMQRKRGTNHADWYFFTCNTNNRLGAGKCTGMYIREEDVFRAIYRQLKIYVNENYISDAQYEQQIQEFSDQINDLTQRKTDAWTSAMEHYELLFQGKISKEDFRTVMDIANKSKEVLVKALESKNSYEIQYNVFRKLLRVSSKDIPLSEITDYNR